MLMLEAYADMYAALGLLEPFSANAPQSAFIVSGEDADGLAVVARLLAARLCGLDKSRAFDDHADIMVFPRRDGEGKKSDKKKKTDTAKQSPMTVDEVRELIRSLYLTPFSLPRRIYIIENAETLSTQCQNKLLKSLEEPPRTVCFILCSTGALLPTVESRCTRIEVMPFAVSDVEARLSAHYADKASVRLAARASRGNLGIAERFLRDKGFFTAYAEAKKLIASATGSRNFAHAALVYEKYSRERAAVVLGLLEYLFGDICRCLAGAETVFEKNEIEALCDGYTPHCAATCAEYVREASRRVCANCMPQAALDWLVLKIMEEKALCRR